MAKISSYPVLSNPTLNDLLIGTDLENFNLTKNFTIGSVLGLFSSSIFVPYTGAGSNVNIGTHSYLGASFIANGGLPTQFLKADGSLDSTSYQVAGNYITGLIGEATASGPGNASITLNNDSVIAKILTGFNVTTGGTVLATDSIVQAFGKVQNQINALIGGVQYQGVWDASTNTPTLTSSVGVQGHYYIVSVSGNTDLNGITDWKVGDWAIFDGSVWDKVDNTDSVVSVNGYTGAVTLTYADVGAPPASRVLTINDTPYDLSANRTWTVGNVRTDSSYANPSWITSLAWSKISSTPSTLAGYGITDGVPYSGASGNVNLGEWGITAGYVGFDLTPTGTPLTLGTMSWDVDASTVDIALTTNYSLKIGEDVVYYVKNQTGSTIPKGTVVRADGTVGASGLIKVAPFLANGIYPSKYCMGVTTEPIANGDNGFVMSFGKIRKVNTSAFPDGTVLYASSTSAGGYTDIPPVAPNNIVSVALVVYSSVNNGELLVRPTFGSNIFEDERVLITSPVNGQVLKYNSASGLFVNGFGGDITGSGTAGQVTYWSGTSAVTGSSNLFWDNTNSRLGIGTTSPIASIETYSNSIYIAGAFSMYSNTATDEPMFYFRRGRGSLTSPTVISAGDTIGSLRFAAQFTATVGSYNTNAKIESVAEASGANLRFYTNTGGFSTSPTLKLQINGNGNTIIQNGGTFTDGGQRLQVIGSMRVGATAASAMYWDDTNSRLGIGVTAPTNTLDVNGKTKTATLLVNDGSAYSIEYNASTTNGKLLSKGSYPSFTLQTAAGQNRVNIENGGPNAVIQMWYGTQSGVYLDTNSDGYYSLGFAYGKTSAPVASAILELSATNRGFLLPRMTTAQKNLITTPATSLMVYDTDLAAFQYYTGSAWTGLGGGISGSGTAGQVTYWSGTSAVTGSADLTIDTSIGRVYLNKSYNGTVAYYVTNASTGTSAIASYTATNGTTTISYGVNGINTTAYGISTANSGYFYSTKNIVFLADNASNGILQFATGGNTEKMRIYTNGNLMLQNGGTFTDGGQRLQVIGSMRVGTTAASAMYWDDTNNRLGIGTSSPASKLNVINTTASEYIATFRASGTPNPAINIEDGDITIPNYSSVGFNPSLTNNTISVITSYSAAGGGMSFAAFTNTTDERALVFSGYSGRTTATTNPVVTFRAAKHDGSTNATTLASNDIAFQFNNWTSGLIRIMGSGNTIIQDGGTFTDGGQRLQVIGSMRVGTTAASAMYWDDTNNRLGIGTSSPGDILDIRKNQVTTSVATTTSLLVSNTNANGIAAIAFTSDGTTRQGGLQYNNTTGQRNLFSCTYTQIPYYFGTNSLIRLTVTGDTGNILINTTTDGGQRLQVIGSMRVGTTAASAMYWDDTNNRLGIGTSSPTGAIEVVGSIKTASNSVQGLIRMAPNNVAYNGSNQIIDFCENYDITNSAVGVIGITNTTWAAPSPSFAFVSTKNGTGTAKDMMFWAQTTPSTSNQAIVIKANTNQIGINGLTSPTALLDINASTTSRSSLRIRSGTAPTSPNDGDIWYDGTYIMHQNGVGTQGALKTASPTSGTSQPWKLGSYVSTTVGLDATGYIEVDINGTFYRLALVTPL